MATRRPFLRPTPSHPELDRLREKARHIKVTEEQLLEQKISFVYGNAPVDSGITKESARKAVERILMTEE